MYSNWGLPNIKEDELFYGDQLPSATQAADQDVTELTVMVNESWACGLNINTLEDNDDDNSSDPDRLEFGISGDQVKLKHGINEDYNKDFMHQLWQTMYTIIHPSWIPSLLTQLSCSYSSAFINVFILCHTSVFIWCTYV